MIAKEKSVKLKALGQVLSERRKERNITLKEAENATSIRFTYLQAIEEGEVEKIISPVYAQGFLRQYATYLGMDGDQIVREHFDLFQKPEKQKFEYGIGSLETRVTPGSQVKWLPSRMWIALFFGMLALAWVLARFFELV